jgi:hypothetical protein
VTSFLPEPAELKGLAGAAIAINEEGTEPAARLETFHTKYISSASVQCQNVKHMFYTAASGTALGNFATVRSHCCHGRAGQSKRATYPVGGRLAFEHALASRRSRLWTNDLLRKIKGLGQSLTYEALLALEEYQSAFFLRVMRREIRILFGMDPSEIAEVFEI